MQDKERILTALVMNIYKSAIWSRDAVQNWKKLNEQFINKGALKKGDLVVAASTVFPNEFSVGFVDENCEDCVRIREIGSDRICEYRNECFLKIPTDLIGEEILEGEKYKAANLAEEAVAGSKYAVKYAGVEFDEEMPESATVKIRKIFSEEVIAKVTFNYMHPPAADGLSNIIDRIIEENKNS